MAMGALILTPMRYFFETLQRKLVQQCDIVWTILYKEGFFRLRDVISCNIVKWGGAKKSTCSA